MKNNNKLKNQHYIFQSYLKNWATEYTRYIEDHYQKFYKIVQIKRENDKYNYSFIDTCDTGADIDFYHYRKLNKIEKEFILSLTESEQEKSSMDSILNQNNFFDNFDALLSSLQSLFENSKKLNEIKDKAEEGKNIIFEDVYGVGEQRLSKLIKKLLIEKTINLDKCQTDNLLRDIAEQSFRTKKSKDCIVNALIEKKEIDVEKCFPYLQFLYAGKVADQLILGEYKASLYENNTDTDLVTTDSPVLFLEDKIYYPISPNFAILISKNEFFSHKLMSEEDVDYYNKQMIKNRGEIIYTFSEKQAKQICDAL